MAEYQGMVIQKDYMALSKKFKATIASKDAEIERLKAIIAKLEGKKRKTD